MFPAAILSKVGRRGVDMAVALRVEVGWVAELPPLLPVSISEAAEHGLLGVQVAESIRIITDPTSAATAMTFLDMAAPSSGWMGRPNSYRGGFVRFL